MKHILVLVVCFFSLLNIAVCQAEQLAKPVYLDGGNSKYGLILCHGRGKYPTFDVVDPLRKAVHQQLGWHTLSLQMPADNIDWLDYADDFPKAYQTIQQGIEFLRQERGVQTIYLMGHSMGARMSAAFVANYKETDLAGLIVAGIRNNGGTPLDGEASLRKVKVPVLDIYGADEFEDVSAANERSYMASDKYRQVSIAKGNHRFVGVEREFTREVIAWLLTRQNQNSNKR
jgi:pimeloyl-ACP methyl ester carboxylesterase